MAMTADQVRTKLRDEAKRAGSMRALAAEMGCALSYLCDIIHSRREPAGKVLDHMGLYRRIEYVKKGRA